MRLRTVSQHDVGWRRVRCGRGFRYLDASGAALPPAEADRVRALVIPPAWSDVWICPDERGHLQAVGTDDAGRRQYLYHPVWREKRDVAKFDRVLAMARRLPWARRKVVADLESSSDPRTRVLATGVRLVDLGCFRPGSDSYTEENGSRGLTTLERRHVRRDGDAVVFEFTGKSGVEQDVRISDPTVARAVDRLVRRRAPDARLLAVRQGRIWVPVVADDLNGYIRDLFGLEVTAKDFRTWHATVAAAVALASEARADSRTARARQVRAAVVETAALLGNTPTVARSAYIHPRVLDLFEAGRTLPRVPVDQDAADRAVVRLLTR
ncbi:MAG: DNA topoisomerase IB [Propionibacteriales bacterium]|nr:DNA topoisomerase IB [Propionibacteriales bacterium]